MSELDAFVCEFKRFWTQIDGFLVASMTSHNWDDGSLATVVLNETRSNPTQSSRQPALAQVYPIEWQFLRKEMHSANGRRGMLSGKESSHIVAIHQPTTGTLKWLIMAVKRCGEMRFVFNLNIKSHRKCIAAKLQCGLSHSSQLNCRLMSWAVRWLSFAIKLLDSSVDDQVLDLSPVARSDSVITMVLSTVWMDCPTCKSHSIWFWPLQLSLPNEWPFENPREVSFAFDALRQQQILNKTHWSVLAPGADWICAMESPVVAAIETVDGIILKSCLHSGAGVLIGSAMNGIFVHQSISCWWFTDIRHRPSSLAQICFHEILKIHRSHTNRIHSNQTECEMSSMKFASIMWIRLII